jgi:hypothetical protein
MRDSDFELDPEDFRFFLKPGRPSPHPSKGSRVAVRQIREILHFYSASFYNYS